MTKFPFVVLVGFTLLSRGVFAAPTEKDIDVIREGVGELVYGNSAPGALNLDENRALPLVEDRNGRVFGAIAESDGARLVAFTHTMFIRDFKNEPNKLLGLNSIRWAGKSRTPSVGLTGKFGSLVAELEKTGMSAADADLSRPLKKFDVICIDGIRPLDDKQLKNLEEFSKQGGGIVVLTTPWAYAKKFEDFGQLPANRVANPHGVYFFPDISGKSKPVFKPSQKRLLEESRETLASILATDGISDEERKQLEKAKQLEGDALKSFLQALRTANEILGPVIPTKKNAIKRDVDGVVVAIMRLEDHFNQTAPAGMMYAIPAAADYPGAIPDGSSRVKRVMKIDGNYKGWLSGRNAGAWAAAEMRPTGLYAAPGEVVTVRVPEKFAGKGLELVIGSYRGSIERKEKWHRYPRMMRKFSMEEAVISASNGMGGLITIAVPRGAELGEIDVMIENAVEAPLYVHGVTTIGEWKSKQRNNPAPWAELASKRMIIALPSEYIRNLDNPDEVMKVWNGIIETSADLVQADRKNYRAERLVFDRQISAGSMHSSYPVAAHTGKSAEAAVDAVGLMANGNWGFFHEYGHNHQHNLWALPGTGETTCNLWSVYVYEEFIGKNRNDTHGSVKPLRRTQSRNAYFRNGRKFEEEWKVWTALDTYLLIQEEFGWDPFKKVFDEYNKLPESQWPKTQQEKNDQWVIRLSKAVGKNLQPYWAKWNLPMTDKVAEELKGLPVWENDPVAKF